LNFRKINLIKEFLVVLSIYFFLKLLKYLDPCKLDENFIFLNKNIFLIMVCYFRVDNIQYIIKELSKLQKAAVQEEEEIGFTTLVEELEMQSEQTKNKEV
jgi:hypothetical protein